MIIKWFYNANGGFPKDIPMNEMKNGIDQYNVAGNAWAEQRQIHAHLLFAQEGRDPFGPA